VLADIPVLGPGKRNEAKRLISLIDALYDNGNRLIVSAEAEPDRLWRGTDATESFEFARTASRLVEMRSDAYWEAHTAGGRSAARRRLDEARHGGTGPPGDTSRMPRWANPDSHTAVTRCSS
jgi:hypothetical protein